jgi:hypothetical protein
MRLSRWAPAVRSLVSIPVGADRTKLGMHRDRQRRLNALLVRGGYLLGSRWQNVERYSHWFDYAVGVLFVAAIGGWVLQKTRKRAAAREGDRA